MELDLLADFQTNLDDFSFRQAQKLCFIDLFRLYSAWGQLAPKTHFRVACVITPSGSLKSTCVMMKLSSLTPAVFSTTQFLLYSLLSRYSWHPSTAMRWGRAGSGQGAVRRGFAGAPSNSPYLIKDGEREKALKKKLLRKDRTVWHVKCQKVWFSGLF